MTRVSQMIDKFEKCNDVLLYMLDVKFIHCIIVNPYMLT